VDRSGQRNQFAEELIKHNYREGWKLPDMPMNFSEPFRQAERNRASLELPRREKVYENKPNLKS